MKIKIRKWNAVATWSWNVDADYCTICQLSFDGCCPDCKIPGDGCYPVHGKCNHPFHAHCLLKWLQSGKSSADQCPICRSVWEYRDGENLPC